VTAAPAESSVRLYDGGNGIFSMDLSGESSVAAVLQALERAQQEVSLEVLLLRGLERSGDPQLARALASFPYPVIALLPGDATGDAFLTAALCDFMVCNEAASYGGSPAATLMAARFGDLLAQQLATVSSGSALRAKGLACRIVPATQIEAQAQELAQSLTTKSQTALRLLKLHLTRNLTVSGGTRVERTATDVLVVNSVHELNAVLNGDSNAIVFAGAEDAISEDVVREAQRLLLATEIPVVAALEGYVRGNAWLLAQLCDAVVYDRQGLYSAAGVTQTAPFARRLGVDAASELVLTGADYSGSELEQRVAGLTVTDRDRVRSTAIELAVSAVKLPRLTLAEPMTPAGELEETPAPLAPTPIALRSNVVTATAHPDGIVVVKLEDRGAKNMFSDAFVDGVKEAFAHIAGSPAYKVVVLTGYDTYFSSGGTKERGR
jgi:enoyl-CoA hydratase/carnithine racemase